jgi:hypothetical protein
VKRFEIGRTIYTVSDFLSWQRSNHLELSPSFQRRSVWKPGAKSYLVDTVVRGLPVPVIFIREKLDLESAATVREVVDGQQRLRTLLSYVEPSSLKDFDPKRDAFVVSRSHNRDVGGKTFAQLDASSRTAILTYQFSVHVLPIGTEDRDVLQIFQRMNSTGQKLNGQELRNAKFYGRLKSLMYSLGTAQLDRWRAWRIFSEDSIARMNEVEMVSDLALNMIKGLNGKSQAKIDSLYRDLDDAFPGEDVFQHRFEATMDAIDRVLGSRIPGTIFRSEVSFFTLFCFFYERMYGLGSPLVVAKPKRVSDTVGQCLLKASDALRDESAPQKVLDAMQRASADLGRRRTRLAYLLETCE